LTLIELQRKHIQKVLETERGNVARAAARLGMAKSTLYSKIKSLAIQT